MASGPSRNTHRSPSASRASLACVPCRQKHVKCDARRPVCGRCASEDKTCHFLGSRRGGLTRRELAERRRNRQGSQARDSTWYTPAESETGNQHEDAATLPTSDEGYVSLSAAVSSSIPVDPGSTSIQDLLDQDWDASGDHYVGLYYEHFHRSHPFVLPHIHLYKMLEEPTSRQRLELLLSVMRSIGSLYSPMSPRSREKITNRISAGTDPRQDAFSVQCLLLNSIALYWCGNEEGSREELDLAISIALSISMQSCTFAAAHGMGNPVLQESWRRTWWQLCIIDAYYAAMQHRMSSLICRPDITTELTCEDRDYETGVCTQPQRFTFMSTTMDTDCFG